MSKGRGKKEKAPGYIEGRGKCIRLELRVAGKRHKYVFETDDIAAVKEFARTEHKRLTEQTNNDRQRERQGLPGPMLVSALFEKFEADVLPTVSDGTASTYRASLKRFREFFSGARDRRVTDIRPGHINEFMTWRRGARVGGKGGKPQTEKPLHNRSLQKDRTVLHRVFAYAEELELRDGNPVARTKAPKPDPRSYVILDKAQYERLLSECDGDEMLRLYALLLGETGVRCESEALWLRWEDVDVADGFLQIVSGRDGHRTKGGRSRHVPLTSRLLIALKAHVLRYRAADYNGTTSPWVFHHATTRRQSKAGERIASLRESFDAAAERAKLPADFRAHDLRHRRVTTWLAEGKSPAKVQMAMGHADLRTTMGYAHLVRENLRELVEEPTARARADTRGR